VEVLEVAKFNDIDRCLYEVIYDNLLQFLNADDDFSRTSVGVGMRLTLVIYSGEIIVFRGAGDAQLLRSFTAQLSAAFEIVNRGNFTPDNSHPHWLDN
jgi:hypothetical protein